MAKSAKKKKATTTKKSRAAKTTSRAAEYVDNLIELHKIQGVLLVNLRKEL